MSSMDSLSTFPIDYNQKTDGLEKEPLVLQSQIVQENCNMERQRQRLPFEALAQPNKQGQELGRSVIYLFQYMPDFYAKAGKLNTFDYTLADIYFAHLEEIVHWIMDLYFINRISYYYKSQNVPFQQISYPSFC